MITKKLSEETEQKIVNPNTTEVTTFLDHNNIKYYFLPSVGQLAMPDFFSAKYIFAIVPTNRKLTIRKNLKKTYAFTL